VNEIEDYIRANRQRYTREAVTEQLRAAGHDSAEIEAAWALVEGATPSAPPATAGAGTMLLVLLLGLGYGLAIVAAGFAAFAGGAVTVLMVVYIVAMLAGGIWSIGRVRRAPSLGEGASAIALAAGVSVVVFIGLSGTCFAFLGPAMSSSHVL
jgi:hypothetical protein